MKCGSVFAYAISRVSLFSGFCTFWSILLICIVSPGDQVR